MVVNSAMVRCEKCEKFIIRILTTSAESPWSNGVCERLNAVIGSNCDKIIYDSSSDLETTLAWAIAARNALRNHSGFSPNQLVFGFNPCFYNRDAPAFEQLCSVSVTVEKNLNAMRKAKEEFLKFNPDEKLNRAMKRNVRESEIQDV